MITAGAGDEYVYIRKAFLNGRPWNSFTFPHELFQAGGTLELELSTTPNRRWGTAR